MSFQAYLDNIKIKTGRTPEDFKKLVEKNFNSTCNPSPSNESKKHPTLTINLKVIMKRISPLLLIVAVFVSCNLNPAANSTGMTNNSGIKDTITYPFKALYSSDLTVPSHPEYAQKVLKVWKLYETKQFDAMKPYYADTVTYDDAHGNHYHGTSEGLLQIARKEMNQLDSLRFDINMWESVHANDKNEDWVNIWCQERNYPKIGHPDTVLMFEQWKLKGGRIYYFNQYFAKLPKSKG